MKKALKNLFINVVFVILFPTFKLIPFERRSKILGTIFGFVFNCVPHMRRQADDNLKRIYPNISKEKRQNIRRQVMRAIGQTGGEMLYNAEYKNLTQFFHVKGPGLELLRRYKKENKGALLLSGHFGQWEACRHVLRMHGMEAGAVYKPMTNRFYNYFHIRALRAAGLPMVKIGYEGTRELYKALKQGKFMAILIDQRDMLGEDLPFLGYPAKTTTVPARLALKLNIPMMPIFTRRIGDGSDIEVDFQLPIEPSDIYTMSTEMNNRLSECILKNPNQWLWVYDRWREC